MEDHTSEDIRTYVRMYVVRIFVKSLSNRNDAKIRSSNIQVPLMTKIVDIWLRPRVLEIRSLLF